MRAFGGTFIEYAEAKGARIGVSRADILLGWVKNRARARHEFYAGLRKSLSPSHTFSESDSLILNQLAANKGYKPEVEIEFSYILGEICFRRIKCEQSQEEMEAQKVSLASQHEKLTEILQDIEQRKRELEELSRHQQSFVQKMESFEQRKQEFIQQQHEFRQQKQQFVQQQSEPKKDDKPPDFFMDNIFTLDVIEEPVVAVDGFTYEKRSILEWFRMNRTSPITGAVLTSTTLIPNHSLKSQINQWREEQARRR